MQWGSALVATRPAPAPLGRPVRARLLGAVAPRIAPVAHAQKLARVCRARERRLCPDSASHPPVPRACSSLCLLCRGFRISAPLPDLLSRHRPVALRLAEGVPLIDRHHSSGEWVGTAERLHSLLRARAPNQPLYSILHLTVCATAHIPEPPQVPHTPEVPRSGACGSSVQRLL